MEPRIQYAKTSDGVSIAYWTLGEGMPLVWTPEPGISHIQLEWQVPIVRRWYERLAEKWMLVRYDGRGIGLSDRDAPRHSLGASVLDLEAVANHLDLESFALEAGMAGGLVAAAYAAKRPERVSHLILWNSATRSSDLLAAKHVRAYEALIDVDWETATETWARVMYPGPENEARQFAAFLRESVTPDVARAQLEVWRDVDVRPLLPNIKSPTLILTRRQIPNRDSARLASDLASRIPDSRLVLLEGSQSNPFLGDSRAVFTAIEEFLKEGEATEPRAGVLSTDIVHTILFTDVEGSTALTDRLGDDRSRELLREHERITREALKSHGGSEVKTMGDGFMASFSSATKALDCAIAIQQGISASDVRVRIGLNAGEPIEEDEDLFGTTVNEAARICSIADGGEILVAAVVRDLTKGKNFLFSDRGETSLRGFEDPVRLYELRWREDV